MRAKKGQAAMEFLMTYGWAILVVLAAIGALAYFGILSPSKFLPSSFTMSGGISSHGYSVSTSGVTLGFLNNVGSQVNITNIVLNTTGGSAVTCNAQGSPHTKVLDNGGNLTSTFSCTGLTSGSKIKADVKVTYYKTQEGATFTHVATGDLTAVVE